MGPVPFPQCFLVLQFLHSHSEINNTVTVDGSLALEGTVIKVTCHGTTASTRSVRKLLKIGK